MPDATITLGGRSFAIRPLTLAQLRVIGPAFMASTGGTAAGIDAMGSIIQAALGRDNPEMTLEAVQALEMDFPELRAAVMAIGHLSGLVDRDAGQGGAAAAPLPGAALLPLTGAA